jgi:hypothetical protein
MKNKLLLVGLLILSISNSTAQGVRNNNVYVTLRGGVVAYIDGNNGHYTSNGTGMIKVFKTTTTPTINVYGNWINNASNTGFYNDSATVRMLNTSSPQSIGGTSSTTFYNLILGGSVKTLNRSIFVGGQSQLNGLLDLTNAELNLNQYTLTITNPNMTIARTSGYINSENGCGTCDVWSSAVTWSAMPNISRVIPFGVSGSYLPVTLNKTEGPNVNITVSTRSAVANNSHIPLNVTHMNVPALGITQSNDGTNTVVDRWWYITPNTSSATPVTLDLNFTYRGSENTTGDNCTSTHFGAQYWVRYSASNYGWKPCEGPTWTCSTMGTWPKVTGVGVTQSGTASTGGVNLPDGNLSTSYWVLSCKNQPLPIELVYFKGVCQDNRKTILQWKTASEVNALKFNIERSTNGLDYITIGSLNAQYPYGGNYSFVDDSRQSGILYYRLKMIDKDGTFKYSPIADVDVDRCNNVRTQIYAYSTNVVVQLQTEQAQKMKVLIYDAIGRVIVDKDIDVQEGYNSFQFPMNVANSIYFVKLVNAKDELIQTQKVVISE